LHLDKEKLLKALFVCYFAWFMLSIISYTATFHPITLLGDMGSVATTVTSSLSSPLNFASLSLIGVTLAFFTKKNVKVLASFLSMISGVISFTVILSLIIAGNRDATTIAMLVATILAITASVLLILSEIFIKE